jgi:hypothetical protein
MVLRSNTGRRVKEQTPLQQACVQRKEEMLPLVQVFKMIGGPIRATSLPVRA